MPTRKMFFGVAVCLLLGVFAQVLLSQSMRPVGMLRPDFERMRDMNPEEKMRYFQKFAEEQRRIIEEQEATGSGTAGTPQGIEFSPAGKVGIDGIARLRSQQDSVNIHRLLYL